MQLLAGSNPLFGGACKDLRLRAWLRHSKVLANAGRRRADDFTVTGNSRCLAICRIPVDGMAPALPEQLTAMCGKVAEKFRPLHETETATNSLRT